MIKDVSRQWAMMFESEADEQKKYSDACEEACRKAEELEKQAIEECDEEVILPEDCGFTEEEVECNEVVDPLQMWKNLKKDKPAEKPQTVKVDNNYITTMKKLLSKIKKSKAKIYDQIINVKLPEYMANGTMLPPPEDFAENFIPFEEIDREVADMSADARGTEYSDTKNPFSNDMAMQNLYDSELTEAEEQEAKEKFKEAAVKAKEATASDPTKEEVKKFFEKNGDKLDKACKVLKGDVKKNVLKIAKALENWAGEVDEAKSKKSSIPVAVVKVLLRILNLVIAVAGYGLLGLGWASNKIGEYSVKAFNKIDDKLAESICLEVEDYLEEEENADAEVIGEDGVTEVKKEEKDPEEGKEEKDESSEVNEADYREPAAHLLDPVGVNASTANLKAQDTALLKVVESLAATVKLLEKRLEKEDKEKESCKGCDESEENPIEEAEDIIEVEDFFKEEEGEEKQQVEEAEPKKLMTAEEFIGIGEADTSFDDENGEEDEEDKKTLAKQAEIDKAIKKVKYYQELSYERDLTDKELEDFRKLVDSIPEYARGEIELPLERSGFARPKNHMATQKVENPDGSTGMKKFTYKDDDGNYYEIPPFNHKGLVRTRKGGSTVDNGTIKLGHIEGLPDNPNDSDYIDLAAEPEENIKFPKRGSKDPWTTKEWNAFLSSISKEKRDDLLDSLISDIENMTPEEAEASSSPELKGKPTDMQKAWQISFIKSLFGKYTNGSKIKIDTRDLGRLLGKSHAGVGKYANDTLEMIFDAMKRATGKSNPSIADFQDLTPDQYKKVKEYLKISVDGKQRRKTGVDASAAPTTSLTTEPDDEEKED